MPSSPGLLSISSAPLTFLAKLRNKKNPYAQPHHPNNNNNNNHGYSHLPVHMHNASFDVESYHDSPHSDLLAQARQAAGRHPVTGRRVGNTTSPQTQKQPETHTGSKLWRRKRKQEVTTTTTTTSVDEARERKKAYLAWAAEHPQTRGSPYESYEEFVSEKVARRGLGEQTWARGEYYAPG